MKKRYSWLLILLPFLALAILAIIIYSKSGGDDWDDDDDDGGRRTALVEDWGGNSPAFRKKVAPGIVISARKNAFEQPTEVAFRPATVEEHEKMSLAVKKQIPDHTPLFSFDLDAGLQPTEHIPGYYTVEMDLEEMGIPETVWPYLQVNRVTDDGIAQTWISWVKHGKLTFHSDQNSGWEVGVAFIAIGSITAWGAAHYKLGSYFGLTRWGTVNCSYYVVPDSVYGTFTIGFNPWETEHPNPLKMDDNIDLLREHMMNAKDLAYERTQRAVNPVAGGTFPLWDNEQQIYDSINFVNTYIQILNEDQDIQRMLNDPAFSVPQSVINIGEMFKKSHEYIRNVQGMKPPMRMCNIYIGTKDLSDQPGYWFHYFDVSPTIFLKVSGPGEYIQPKKMIRENGRDVPEREEWLAGDGTVKYFTPQVINDSKRDVLYVTICHELYHHYQSSTILSSQFKNIRLAEATAAVLERDFVKYLVENDELISAPSEDLYAPNEELEWLLAPLDIAIMPSFVDYDDLMITVPKFWRKCVESTARRLANGELLTGMKADCEEFCHQFGITFEQTIDILGMCSEVINGPNCNAGYMLGDFIMYLRDKVAPDAKLSCFSRDQGGFNFSDLVKLSLNINDEDFDKYYTEFCALNIGKIVNRQVKKNKESKFRVEYDGQFMDSITVSRTKPIHKLRCWRQSGKFACRTVKFIPENPRELYNLMLLPSESMKGAGQEAVRPYVAKGDTAFAPQEFYLEADSNNNKSPRAAALIMTSKINNVSLTVDHYYDAVAFYGPNVGPKLLASNGDYARVSLFAWPEEALLERDYVSGVEFMVKDNRTGNIYATKIPMPIEERDRFEREGFNTTISLPAASNGEERDLTAYARWYYQPDPEDDSTCYYSALSEQGQGEVTLLVDNDTYICQVGDDLLSHLAQNGPTYPTGHLKAWSNGQFEFYSPAINVANVKVPEFRAAGYGSFSNDTNGQVFLDFENVITNVDSTSFTYTLGVSIERRINGSLVSTVYRVTSPQGFALAFNGRKQQEPNAPIKVSLVFPKAKTRIGNSDFRLAEFNIFGVGKKWDSSGQTEDIRINPFDDF